MSLRMVRVFAVFQVLTLSGASAFAAVQCPQSLSGRALRTSGGAHYLMVLLATTHPSRQTARNNFVVHGSTAGVLALASQ